VKGSRGLFAVQTVFLLQSRRDARMKKLRDVKQAYKAVRRETSRGLFAVQTAPTSFKA